MLWRLVLGVADLWSYGDCNDGLKGLFMEYEDVPRFDVEAAAATCSVDDPTSRDVLRQRWFNSSLTASILHYSSNI